MTEPRPDRTEPTRRARTSLVEALLDNLPAWTIVAAAVSFLYLVWATLEILGRYTGGFPTVGP